MTAAIDLSNALDGCGLAPLWWAEMSAFVCFLLGAALLRRKSASPCSSELDGAATLAKPDLSSLQLAAIDNPNVSELLNLMQRPACPTEEEGLCIRLLASIAESGCPDLVAQAASCARQRLQLTSPLCAALLRAYASAGLDSEARGLYAEVLAQAVELDDEAEELYDALLGKDL